MLANTYITKRDSIIDLFSNKFSIWENDFVMGKFNLVSASLMNYLPDIPYAIHEKIFSEILKHQQLSVLEQAYPKILEYTTIEGISKKAIHYLKQQPAIICTFHTGSYRILNHFLLNNKISYSLVVGKSVFENQRKEFEDLHHNFYKQSSTMFNLIDAEAPNSMLQMIREIKRKKVLVFYIDGNTGVEIKNEDKNNLCDIQFLHQRLFARKGIASLSCITNVPILTVACSRKSIDEISLTFFDWINHDNKKSREENSLLITQQIFDYVMPIIKKYPEQWEGWLYIHNSMNLINRIDVQFESIFSNGDHEFKFNKMNFGLFEINSQTYLFKKDNFSFFPIENHLYNYLRKNISTTIRKEEISDELFFELYQNKVLV